MSFSSAWQRAGAQNTVFEWRNEFLRNPQLSNIKVGANWILFSSKDFVAAECFHTFVKGMKSTYEDLSLFSCLQTQTSTGLSKQGRGNRGPPQRVREVRLGLMDETGLPQANKTGEGIEVGRGPARKCRPRVSLETPRRTEKGRNG